MAIRLVGEDLEQRDLSPSEELDLGTAQRDRAYRDAFPHQGHAKDGVDTPTLRVCATFRKFADLSPHISKMDGPSVEDGSARNRPADQWERLESDWTLMGDEDETVVLPTA
jgi:hypothetical protein